MNKQEEYTAKIFAQLIQLFDEDCENHIDLNDFDDDDNSTDFMHALANLAPAILHAKLTGTEKINLLEFNHMANQLIFQNKK